MAARKGPGVMMTSVWGVTSLLKTGGCGIEGLIGMP